MPGPKEEAYDEHISPLMTEIIALCKKHNINAFMHFILDFDEEREGEITCTTALPIADDDPEGKKTIKMLHRSTKPQAMIWTTVVKTES